MKKEKTKDYIFVYSGYMDNGFFICSAKNGDEAMKKFNKEVNI
jgi:hypothetical protein